MLFVCPAKILHKLCFQFLFDSQEKLKTILVKNFEVPHKEHHGMLWYFLEWSILFDINTLAKAEWYILLFL